MLTSEKLKEVLDYCPETGNFFWRVRRGRQKAGSLAGHADTHGYIMIRVFSKIYMAHRLAFLFVYDRFPIGDTDHINRNRSDNRIENLREVTRSENNVNSKIRKNNTSGYRGVSWSERDKHYHAYINKDGRRINIGYFRDSKEAAIAYDEKAKDIYGEKAELNFGEDKCS